MAEERDWAAELKAMADKNAELIGELRESSKKLKQFENIDLESLTGAAKELETLKIEKQKEVGEFKTLYEREVESRKQVLSELEAAKERANSLTKRHKIAEAMPPKTFPELRDLAIDDIYRKSTLADDGTVVVDGMPVADFVKSWQETPVGKHFIAAEDNTGGGASGNRAGTAKDPDIAAFKKGDKGYNVTRQAQIRKTDPERAERLAKLANN
jgi:hypothetical protein